MYSIGFNSNFGLILRPSAEAKPKFSKKPPFKNRPFRRPKMKTLINNYPKWNWLRHTTGRQRQK
jgi:hypothetical protein